MKKLSAETITSIVVYFISFILTPKLFSQEISWELTNGPEDSTGTYLNVFALGSTKDGNIFAGTNQAGVFKSTDKGITWLNCSSPELINSTIHYLVIDSNDVIYVASSEGLFKSFNHGENWFRMINGLPFPYSSYQSISVGNDGLSFAGYSGIFRSLDYGFSWSFSGLDSCFVWIIKIFKDSIVVAGTFNYGPFISTDRGETWNSINDGLNQNQIIGLAISSTGSLLVGVTGGVYRSIDWGNSWEQVLTTSPVWVGVIFIFSDQFMFSGTAGEGIFISSNNGNNWNNIHSGLSNLFINAFCRSNDGFVYAGSDSGVYITSNPITSISYIKSSLPSVYSLSQNYPNPFNPRTKITWQSPIGSNQTLKIYDVLGNEVATLIDEYKPAGNYEVEWDASGLPSGVYFYQMKTDGFVGTKKMILMK